MKLVWKKLCQNAMQLMPMCTIHKRKNYNVFVNTAQAFFLTLRLFLTLHNLIDLFNKNMKCTIHLKSLPCMTYFDPLAVLWATTHSVCLPKFTHWQQNSLFEMCRGGERDRYRCWEFGFKIINPCFKIKLTASLPKYRQKKR